MYHEQLIRSRIEAAVRASYIQAPEYHTRVEIERVNRSLNAKFSLDDDRKAKCRMCGDGYLENLWKQGGFKCPGCGVSLFDQAEWEWIRNERFLCRNDFLYFAKNYCWIKNFADQVVQFEPWVSQKIFLSTVADMELEGLAIFIQQLKARQLGISRLISLMILHRTMFFPHVNSLIGSSTPAKTLKLLDMWEFPFDRLPFWMVPAVTARRRDGEGGFVEFGNMDTAVTLQHGAQMSGIARGTTPTIFHLTEMAEFTNGESIVDASLMRAVHDHPRVLGILEGTGEGYNWWYKKWVSTKEGWPEKRSRFRPSFLPWFVGTDLYPDPTWLLAHPVPQGYQARPYVVEHARKAKEYANSDGLMRKYLGEDWTMPQIQQWFYECSYEEARSMNQVNLFLQEMPASDDEAFQTSNISVFDAETLTVHKQRTKAPVGVYGLVGPTDEVPTRLQPHPGAIDRSKPVIPITAKWGASPAITYQLVPLIWNGFSTDPGTDKIYIWEHPVPGKKYGMGVDTSYGIGKDRTTLEGIRMGDAFAPCAQAFEFASDKVNSMDAIPFCLALGTYFSVPQFLDPGQAILDKVSDGQESFRQQIRMAIEIKGSGDQTQLQLRFKGWTNFHPWKRIDDRVLDPSKHTKLGVYTNEWFRDEVISYLMQMLRDMEIEVFSPWLVREMATLETRWDRKRIEAAKGEFDDRFFALGFIVVSLYQWYKLRKTSFHPARPHEQEPEKVIRRYSPMPRNIQEVPLAIE